MIKRTSCLRDYINLSSIRARQCSYGIKKFNCSCFFCHWSFSISCCEAFIQRTNLSASVYYFQYLLVCNFCIGYTVRQFIFCYHLFQIAHREPSEILPMLILVRNWVVPRLLQPVTGHLLAHRLDPKQVFRGFGFNGIQLTTFIIGVFLLFIPLHIC